MDNTNGRFFIKNKQIIKNKRSRSYNALKQFGFVFLFLIQSASAQTEEEWKWSFFASDSTNGSQSGEGVAENYSAAESAMKGACAVCKKATLERTTKFNSSTIGYIFHVTPQDVPADYSPWDEHLASRIEELIAAFTPISSPECSPVKATPVGGWYNATAPNYDPPIRQSHDVTVTIYSYNPSTMVCTSSDLAVAPAFRTRVAECDEGYTPVAIPILGDDGLFFFTNECRVNFSGSIQGPPVKPDCDDQTLNPCSISTGDKLKSQTDISLNGLSFTRSYNSLQTQTSGVIGKAWRHNYDDRLHLQAAAILSFYISPKGRHLALSPSGVDQYVVNDAENTSPSAQQLSKINDQWQMTFVNGNKRTYDAEGLLVKIETAAGKTNTLTYDNAQLTSVTGEYGKSLNFTYTDDRISQITQPDGTAVHYQYDVIGNLVSVIYPDTTPANDTDNPSMILHYEDPRFVHHLTGITDENGDRYQTYEYDASARVIQSEKANTSNTVGQERFQLDYQNQGQE